MAQYTIGFTKLGIDLNKVTAGGYTTCPQCSHTRKPSNRKKRVLAVNLQSGNYNCSHCDFKGRVDSNEWINKKEMERFNVNTPNLTPNTAKIQRTAIKPYHTKPLTENALKWLKSERGISEQTAIENKLAFNRNTICINYYKGDVIVGAKYRSLEKKFFWQHAGTKKYLYGLNHIKGQDTAIIVEGEFDKLALYEAGIKNAVSVAQGAPNAGTDVGTKLQCLDNSINYIKDLKKVILACDNDENGRYLTKVLIERFGANRCAIVEMPEDCKDCNDVLLKYGKEKLQQIIKDAKETPIQGVRTVNQAREKLLHNYHHGFRKGISTCIPELEGVFSWYKGWWGLWHGIPNSGKSAFVHFAMICASVHWGWKWAVFSPEHYPEEDFYIDMITLLAGRPIDNKYNNKLTLEEFEIGMEWMNEHFFFVFPQADEMSNTNTNVLSKIKELKLSKGIDGFLIDPYNQLVRESSEKIDVYLEKSLNDVDMLCKTHNLQGNIVAHPTKLYKEKDEQDYKKSTPYEVAGGAMWYNKAYTIGNVHRPFNQSDKHDRTVEIDIQKVKSHKRVGTPDCITLEFDPKTGWYHSVGGGCALDGEFGKILQQRGVKQTKLNLGLDPWGDKLPF